MEKQYKYPDADVIREACAGVPEAQAIIIAHYRNYVRVCLRSIALSFHAKPNRYDLEDLEQRVMMETLAAIRMFIPDYSNKDQT